MAKRASSPSCGQMKFSSSALGIAAAKIPRLVGNLIYPHSSSPPLSSHCGDAISTSNKGSVRIWQAVSQPSHSVDPADKRLSFTICTYNVLSQYSLENSMYLYETCRKEHLAWPHRWELLKKELNNLKADIFCLQEVDDVAYPSFTSFFKRRNYLGTFKRRTGEKHDGCAIFWRKDMFKMVEGKGVDYVIPNSYVDRDNVGLIMKFKIRRSFLPKGAPLDKERRALIVANTHLLYNMNRGDIKLAQLAMLLAHVQKMAKIDCKLDTKQSRYPVLLCGDFNSLPASPLVNFLTSGTLRYVEKFTKEIACAQNKGGYVLRYPVLPAHSAVMEHCCQFREALDGCECSLGEERRDGVLGHKLNLSSAFVNEQLKVNYSEVSTVLKGSARLCDFIFHGPKIESDTEPTGSYLECVSRSSLLTETQVLNAVGFLPNDQCGSDHLPLLANYNFVFKAKLINAK